jgi:hypothetical protein
MKRIDARLKEKCLMELEKTLMQLLESIEDCFLKHRLLPCLILPYSAIDIVSSLESGGARGWRL